MAPPQPRVDQHADRSAGVGRIDDTDRFGADGGGQGGSRRASYEVERRAGGRGRRDRDRVEDGLRAVDQPGDAQLVRAAGPEVEPVVVPGIRVCARLGRARGPVPLSVEMKFADADWFSPVRSDSYPDIVVPEPVLELLAIDDEAAGRFGPLRPGLAWAAERIGIGPVEVVRKLPGVPPPRS